MSAYLVPSDKIEFLFRFWEQTYLASKLNPAWWTAIRATAPCNQNEHSWGDSRRIDTQSYYYAKKWLCTTVRNTASNLSCDKFRGDTSTSSKNLINRERRAWRSISALTHEMLVSISSLTLFSSFAVVTPSLMCLHLIEELGCRRRIKGLEASDCSTARRTWTDYSTALQWVCSPLHHSLPRCCFGLTSLLKTCQSDKSQNVCGSMSVL